MVKIIIKNFYFLIEQAELVQFFCEWTSSNRQIIVTKYFLYTFSEIEIDVCEVIKINYKRETLNAYFWHSLTTLTQLIEYYHYLQPYMIKYGFFTVESELYMWLSLCPWREIDILYFLRDTQRFSDRAVQRSVHVHSLRKFSLFF